MKMPLNHEETQAIVEGTTRFAMEGDSATRLLVGNLVAFLVKKGLIDQDEYLQETLKTKEFLSENYEPEKESDLKMVENIFNLHINDLKAPD
jgi:hypothetical protein